MRESRFFCFSFSFRYILVSNSLYLLDYPTTPVDSLYAISRIPCRFLQVGEMGREEREEEGALIEEGREAEAKLVSP